MLRPCLGQAGMQRKREKRRASFARALSARGAMLGSHEQVLTLNPSHARPCVTDRVAAAPQLTEQQPQVRPRSPESRMPAILSRLMGILRSAWVSCCRAGSCFHSVHLCLHLMRPKSTMSSVFWLCSPPTTQLGRAQFSAEERCRHRTAGACLYCGQ